MRRLTQFSQESRACAAFSIKAAQALFGLPKLPELAREVAGSLALKQLRPALRIDWRNFARSKTAHTCVFTQSPE
jgi:hypothetical protein